MTVTINPYQPGDEERMVDTEEVKTLLQKRREMVQTYARQSTQSERGKLFEMLADLGDDDSAYAEMQDLDDVAGWLIDSQE